MLLEEQREKAQGGTRQGLFTMGHGNAVNMSERLEHEPLCYHWIHSRPFPKGRPKTGSLGGKKHWGCPMSLAQAHVHLLRKKLLLLVCPARRENSKGSSKVELQV